MKRAKQYLIVAVAVLSFVTCGKNEKGNPQPAQPKVSVTGTYELLTGEPLNTLTLTGTAIHEGQAVAGAFAWKDGATTYKTAGQYDAPWVFTPSDAGKYAPAEGTVTVSVDLSVSWTLLTSDFYGLRDFSGSDVSNYGMAMNMLDNGTVEYRMFTRLRNTGATIPVAFVPEENVCAILNRNVEINDPSSNMLIDWQQLTPFNGEYVACTDTFNTPDNKGKLFRAADPYLFWDRASRSTFVYRILGVKNASLSAIVQENGKYVFARTSDLENWETGREVPDDFPRDGGFARLPGEDASRPLLLVGGVNGPTYYDLKYLNTVWRSSDGLTWEKTASTQPPFPEGMAGASLAEYGGTLYLIGGVNRAGQPTKSIVCSSDGGVSWQPAGKAMELPAEYSARAYASVFVTPDNTFLIFSGIADFQPVNPPYLFEIWEGRIAGL